MCHPALLLVTVDLPARALVTCLKQYNGRCSCLFCEEVGVSVSTQIYWPYNDGSTSVQRTLHSVKRDIELANARGEPVSSTFRLH